MSVIFASLVGISVIFGSNPFARFINGVTLMFIINLFNVGDVIMIDEKSYFVFKITLLTVVKNKFDIVYVWSNGDLLNKMSEIVNLSVQNYHNFHNVNNGYGNGNGDGNSNNDEIIFPCQKLEIYLSYKTSKEELHLLLKEFKNYLSNSEQLNLRCSNNSVHYTIKNLDALFVSKIIFSVQSYISFGNDKLRWRVHSKLYQELRTISNDLNIQQCINHITSSQRTWTQYTNENAKGYAQNTPSSSKKKYIPAHTRMLFNIINYTLFSNANMILSWSCFIFLLPYTVLGMV